MVVNIYILISLLNIIIKIINECILLTIITNYGYKYEDNIRILKKYFIHLLVCFIPLINFILRIKEIINLIFNKKYFKQLKSNYSVIPLTEKELFLYYYNKSFITILNLNFFHKNSPTCMIFFTKNNLENTIYYTILENQFVITSIKGPVSKLKRKKQYEELKKQLKEINCKILTY